MPIPPRVSVAQYDRPKPIDFQNWRHQPHNPPIMVVGVETNLFGPPTPLPPHWNAAWKFINHGLGTGGTGVKGELVFDRSSATPAECIGFYDAVLWPQRALLTLICEYPGEPQELLEVQLVL